MRPKKKRKRHSSQARSCSSHFDKTYFPYNLEASVHVDTAQLGGGGGLKERCKLSPTRLNRDLETEMCMDALWAGFHSLLDQHNITNYHSSGVRQSGPEASTAGRPWDVLRTTWTVADV